MKAALRNFRKPSFYKEIRYIYNSAFKYREALAYLHNRFIIGPKIFSLLGPVDRPVVNENYSIHFLCGQRDLLMLLWSIAGWYKGCSESGRVYIHDDGTFDFQDRQILGRLLPNVTVVDYKEIGERVLNALADRFPTAYHYRKLSLHDRRYIFNLKLIDPFFVGDADVKLILDSDLLWFKQPGELLDDIFQKRLPIFMGGYGKMDFVFSDGSILPENIAGVNSGVVCYKKKQFSLDSLEEFYSRVGSNANPHFVEQAGYAYILTRGSQPIFLPADKYLIKGPVSERTVMKHYTNPRREQFWFEGVNRLKGEVLK